MADRRAEGSWSDEWRAGAARWRMRLLGTPAGMAPDEPLAGLIRAKQVQAVLRLSPLTMLANVLNAALIAFAFHASVHRVALALWCGCVVVLAVYGTRSWQAWRRGQVRNSASVRVIRRSTLHASLLALVWSFPLVWFPDADPPRQLLLATITAGMMCAGGFALATLPLAGTAYVVILGAASGATLFAAGFPLSGPIGALLCIYAFIVIASVWSTAAMFEGRLLAEHDAERQSQVVGLLLRDFEEHASDVLWEMDEDGRFCHVSPRMSAAFGLSVRELTSVRALRLLARAQAGLTGAERAPTRELLASIGTCTPFRDVVMPLRTAGQTRWWSLTAKPLIDGHGRCIGWRGVATDVTEAQLATDRLTYLAHFDPLTGLTNRHRLRVHLAELLTPPSGPPRACAVLFLDLDHFKTINDTLGHAAGDLLLQEVARRLVASARPGDIVARLGGDEFALILKDVESPDDAERITRRVQELLHQPCEVQGARLSVRSSVGIAMAPRDAADIDSLLNHADLALYAAKSGGRNDYRLFAPTMVASTRRRLAIENALRGALDRGELTLVFQPQIDINAWTIVGFEALLRWTHPELGTVGPAEFVAVAEDAGLVSEIGEWVMREACRAAHGWAGDLRVSVNVSAVQVMNENLPAKVQRTLAESGLPAHRLELEITESVFLNETRTTMQVLRSLHRLGVRIALDDFGVGYSSLAYLRSFPFHTLKIDRSFVRELMTRRDVRAIVKTIVALASTLRMSTVAEGVEEPAQLHVLERYGCGAMQGYFVAGPMAADDVARFIDDWPSQPQPQDTVPSGVAALTDFGTHRSH